jgi:hypothetical protein
MESTEPSDVIDQGLICRAGGYNPAGELVTMNAKPRADLDLRSSFSGTLYVGGGSLSGADSVLNDSKATVAPGYRHISSISSSQTYGVRVFSPFHSNMIGTKDYGFSGKLDLWLGPAQG